MFEFYKYDKSFRIGFYSLIILFFSNIFFFHVFSINIPGSIAFDGYIRVILLLLLLFHLPDIQIHHFDTNKALKTSLMIFLIVLMVQLGISENKLVDIRGSIKYFVYIFIILHLINNTKSINKKGEILINLALVLFFLVIIFYPYYIIKSNFDFYGFSDRIGKAGFLLSAGNEDAHFMVCLFPFVIYKIKKIHYQILLSFLLFVSLAYNGTRSALISFAIILIFLFTFKGKNVFLRILSVLLLIGLGFGIILSYYQTILGSELRIIYDFDSFIHGENVGGNLSGRVYRIWIPAITETLNSSPIFGQGPQGWLKIGDAVYSTLHNTTYSPHNLFVFVFVNFGFLGLILIAFIIFKIFFDALRNFKKSIHFTTIFISSWFAFFLWSLIANSQGTHGWTVLIILISLSCYYNELEAKQ